MHEMSLCQNIMEIIDQQQKMHEIHEVTDIWLEIGALSCVEQSAVEFCFEIMRKDTVAENLSVTFYSFTCDCMVLAMSKWKLRLKPIKIAVHIVTVHVYNVEVAPNLE